MALSGEFLSSSSNGLSIKIAAIATAGDNIHTSSSTAKDYITIYAFNSDPDAQTLTLEWGGVTTPDRLITAVIQPGVLTPVVPKLPLSNGNSVAAFASKTNVVMIYGSVDRAS